jgi:hypothetical protein
MAAAKDGSNQPQSFAFAFLCVENLLTLIFVTPINPNLPPNVPRGTFFVLGGVDLKSAFPLRTCAPPFLFLRVLVF